MKLNVVSLGKKYIILKRTEVYFYAGKAIVSETSEAGALWIRVYVFKFEGPPLLFVDGECKKPLYCIKT